MGRMLKYRSAFALQAAVDRYFESCRGQILRDGKGNPIMDKNGQPILYGAKPLTVSGLALSLGVSRMTLLRYQGRPQYSDIIEEAKQRIEEYAECRLYDRDGANGAKYVLASNFWLSSGSDSGEVTIVDDI